MPIRIFNNITSLSAQRSLTLNNNRVGNTVTRIASGIRVNRASDDAASFAVSEFLRSDSRVLRQGQKNASEAISLISTAEGALTQTASILIRLKELAQQASTGTLGDQQRDSIQLEFKSLLSEIDRIASTTEFNGKKLIDGSLSSSAGNQTVISVGLNSSSNNLLNLNTEINLTSASTTGLGINAISASTRENALLAIRDLEDGIDQLSSTRGRVGSTLERLVHAVAHINRNVQGLTQAESTLRDADLGKEFAELTRNQILVQSSAAMIGQANLIPRSVLQLLQ